MTAAVEDLPESLRDAVQAWREPRELFLFRQHWAGTWDANNPHETCLTLVRFASEVACDPKDAGLQAALELLNNVNHLGAAVELLNVPESHLRQTANLMKGLLACVSAAVQFVGDGRVVTANVAKHLGRAAAAYNEAWPLSEQVVSVTSNHFEGGSPAARILAAAAKDSAFGDPLSLTVSTWLILQRLLTILLGTPDVAEKSPQNLKLLLYGGDKKGHVGPLSVWAMEEGQWGFYPDPVAFGVTIIHESMQHSLKLAWRVCEQSLLSRMSATTQTPLSLRLVPGLPQSVHTLTGDSAGGLFACGMYAASTGKPLDFCRTATCALELSPGAPETGPLELEHVRLKGVGKVPAKLAAIMGTDIAEVVLEKSQADAWNRSYQSHTPPPHITGASTLTELFERITGDAKHEALLGRHADIVSGQWDQIRTAKAASRPALRDENETHRFDCYVPPDYRIERPPQQGEKQLRPISTNDEHKSEGGENDRSVPGVGDEQLRHLLQLLRTNTVWEDAPSWLRKSQEPGPRGLVVYDNAGSGKTVFTFRAAHVLAERATWGMFVGRAPLVVRIEGHWPQESDAPRNVTEQRFLSLRGALEQTVLEEFRESGQPLDAAIVKACVRYALDQQRVVVILDGFDQFDPADRELVVNMLSGRGRDRDAVNGCAWIITSRVHTIEAHRSDLFDDRHWVRVRIDPLSQKQQNDYFAHPTRDGRDLRPLWQQTIGITEAMDEETAASIRERMDELLRLPMTLWYIRKLIELTPASQPLPMFQTLSELSLTVSRRLLERALEKSADAVKAALQVHGIPTPDLNDAARMQLLEHVLTLMAFELMLEENYNGEVDATAILDFEGRCQDRWFRELNLAMEQRLTPSRKLVLNKQLETRHQHWEWAVAVLKTIELNHRSVTERYGKTGLAFRSRKIVEANAARFLTKYATEWDIFREDEGMPCAHDFTNDLDWRDCWLLAIEMPRHGPAGDEAQGLDAAVTLRSLSVLFRQPKQEIRPTELIYRAWHLFEVDDQLLRERQFLIDGQLVFGAELSAEERQQLGIKFLLPEPDSVLAEFRSSSRDLVTEMERNSFQQQAASKNGHDTWLRTWQVAECHTKSRTLVQCPPQVWLDEFAKGNRRQNPCVNVMGSTDDDEGARDTEKPQHQVKIVHPLLSLLASVNGVTVTKKLHITNGRRGQKEFRECEAAPPITPKKSPTCRV